MVYFKERVDEEMRTWSNLLHEKTARKRRTV